MPLKTEQWPEFGALVQIHLSFEYASLYQPFLKDSTIEIVLKHNKWKLLYFLLFLFKIVPTVCGFISSFLFKFITHVNVNTFFNFSPLDYKLPCD